MDDNVLVEIQSVVRKLESPYAFQDGKCIPKYEKGFQGYEYCRQDVLKVLKVWLKE